MKPKTDVSPDTSAGTNNKHKRLSLPWILGIVALAIHIGIALFLWLGGVEELILPLGPSALWIFTAAISFSHLPLGRVIKPAIVGWANSDIDKLSTAERSKKILKTQREGFLVLEVGMLLSLIGLLLIHDVYRQRYIVQISLGVTTGTYALWSLLFNRELLTEKARPQAIVIAMMVVILSLFFALPYDITFIIAGTSGLYIFALLFRLIPEILARGLTSVSYDILSAYGSGYIRAGKGEGRHARASRDFWDGFMPIQSCLFLFPMLGQILATGGSVFGWTFFPGWEKLHSTIPQIQLQIISQLGVATISSFFAVLGIMWHAGLRRRFFQWREKHKQATQTEGDHLR